MLRVAGVGVGVGVVVVFGDGFRGGVGGGGGLAIAAAAAGVGLLGGVAGERAALDGELAAGVVGVFEVWGEGWLGG